MPRGRRPRSKAGVFPLPLFRPAFDSPDPVPEPRTAPCEPAPRRRGPKPKPVNHEVRIVAENVTVRWD